MLTFIVGLLCLAVGFAIGRYGQKVEGAAVAEVSKVETVAKSVSADVKKL